MRTAIEACAARTEPCVENAKLSTDSHAESVLRPQQFRLRLEEANKTELLAKLMRNQGRKRALDIKQMYIWN